MISKKEFIIEPKEVKDIIYELGLVGTEFAKIMGKNKNYVTDFNRYGVPSNVSIILGLSKKLMELGVKPDDIILLLKKYGKQMEVNRVDIPSTPSF